MSGQPVVWLLLLAAVVFVVHAYRQVLVLRALRGSHLQPYRRVAIVSPADIPEAARSAFAATDSWAAAHGFRQEDFWRYELAAAGSEPIFAAVYGHDSCPARMVAFAARMPADLPQWHAVFVSWRARGLPLLTQNMSELTRVPPLHNYDAQDAWTLDPAAQWHRHLARAEAAGCVEPPPAEQFVADVQRDCAEDYRLATAAGMFRPVDDGYRFTWRGAWRYARNMERCNARVMKLLATRQHIGAPPGQQDPPGGTAQWQPLLRVDKNVGAEQAPWRLGGALVVFSAVMLVSLVYQKRADLARHVDPAPATVVDWKARIAGGNSPEERAMDAGWAVGEYASKRNWVAVDQLLPVVQATLADPALTTEMRTYLRRSVATSLWLSHRPQQAALSRQMFIEDLAACHFPGTHPDSCAAGILLDRAEVRTEYGREGSDGDPTERTARHEDLQQALTIARAHRGGLGKDERNDYLLARAASELAAVEDKVGNQTAAIALLREARALHINGWSQFDDDVRLMRLLRNRHADAEAFAVAEEMTQTSWDEEEPEKRTYPQAALIELAWMHLETGSPDHARATLDREVPAPSGAEWLAIDYIAAQEGGRSEQARRALDRLLQIAALAETEYGRSLYGMDRDEVQSLIGLGNDPDETRMGRIARPVLQEAARVRPEDPQRAAALVKLVSRPSRHACYP